MKPKFYFLRSLLLAPLLAFGASSVAQGQCTAPSSITHSVTRCDSVSFTWPAVTGVGSYLYAVNQVANYTGAGASTTSTSAKVGGLYPGTRYYIHVRSNCSTSVSPYANDSFTTPACGPGICLAPQSITSSNVTNNSITYSWTAFPGALGYEYVADQSDQNPSGSGIATTATTFTRTGLTGGTFYYFHVRTKCGTNSFSDWKTSIGDRTTGSDPNCPTPTPVTTPFLRCDSVVFTWPSAAAHTGYLYTMSTTPNVGPSLSITANSVSRRNLTASTLYYVQVVANCSLSRSAVRVDSFRTPACGATNCVPPASVTNATVTPTTASFTWPAVTGAIGYECVIDRTTANPTVSGNAVTGTSASVSGLTPNTTYYLHIRSKCSATVFSPWKAATTVVTPATTGIGNQESGDGSFVVVYPNPASRSVSIHLNSQPGKNAQLDILSVDGRKVKTIAPSIHTDLDISELKSGVYFIKYADDSQRQVVRFIKD